MIFVGILLPLCSPDTYLASLPFSEDTLETSTSSTLVTFLVFMVLSVDVSDSRVDKSLFSEGDSLRDIRFVFTALRASQWLPTRGPL